MVLGTDPLIARLRNSIGLEPDRDWLDACRSFSQGHGGSDDEGDAVLDHLLHSDLRDVVRPRQMQGSRTNGSREHRAPLLASANDLREAIRSSRPSPGAIRNNPKTTTKLGPSFRLLCQIEEVTDVSLNAEAKLSTAVNPENAPNTRGPNGGYQNNQNQGNRGNSYNNGPKMPSLKLCLTDGREPDPILAMVVEKIPELDARTLAGAKLVLSGEVEVVWGTLLLHPGNTTFVGGYVQDLVEFQRSELQKAKKAAGVGVDMTVRALIGTSPDSLEDDQNDEGDGESGDVVAAPTVPQHLIEQEQVPVLAPEAIANQSNSASEIRERRVGGQHNQNRAIGNIQEPMTIRQVSVTGPSSPTYDVTGATTPRDQRKNPYATRSVNLVRTTPNQLESTPEPRIFSSASRESVNPYFRPKETSFSASASSRRVPVANPYAAKATDTQQSQISAGSRDAGSTVNNPYATPLLGAQSATQASTRSNSLVQKNEKSPYSHGDEAKTEPLNVQSQSSEDHSRTAANTVSSASESAPYATSPPTSMDFTTFFNLLKRCTSDQEAYASNYGRVFVVSLKQCSGPVDFDIKKCKGSNKLNGKKEKKTKKYEYFMSASFTGPNGGESIKCKISSACIVPYFDRPPAEMRILNRSDRAKSNALVKEAGLRVKDELFGLLSWELTFLLSPDEFSSVKGPKFSLDGKSPIVLLLRRHDVTS